MNSKILFIGLIILIIFFIYQFYITNKKLKTVTGKLLSLQLDYNKLYTLTSSHNTEPSENSLITVNQHINHFNPLLTDNNNNLSENNPTIPKMSNNISSNKTKSESKFKSSPLFDIKYSDMYTIPIKNNENYDNDNHNDNDNDNDNYNENDDDNSYDYLIAPQKEEVLLNQNNTCYNDNSEPISITYDDINVNNLFNTHNTTKYKTKLDNEAKKLLSELKYDLKTNMCSETNLTFTEIMNNDNNPIMGPFVSCLLNNIQHIEPKKQIIPHMKIEVIDNDTFIISHPTINNQSKQVEQHSEPSKTKIEQLLDQSVEQLVDQSVEQLVDQSVKQLVDQSVKQLVDQSVKQLVDQSVEQLVDQSVEQLVDQSVEQLVDQSVKQLVDQSVEQLVELQIEPQVEQHVEPQVEQHVEPQVEQHVEQLEQLEQLEQDGGPVDGSNNELYEKYRKLKIEEIRLKCIEKKIKLSYNKKQKKKSELINELILLQ